MKKEKFPYKRLSAALLPLLFIAGNTFAQTTPPPNPSCSFGLMGASRLLDTNAALDDDGHLWIWGYFGVLNYQTKGAGGPGGGPNGAPSAPVYLSDRAIYNPPTKFKALDNIVSTAATAYTIAALDDRGNLWAWGDGNDLVFGRDYTGAEAPEKVPDGANQYDLTASTWKPIAQNVVGVAGIEYGYAYLTDQGKVWTTGHNLFGQRGIGTVGGTVNSLRNQTQIRDEDWPVLPVASGGTGKTPFIVAVYNGYEGFMAQDMRGNIYAWGRSFESGLGTSGYYLNGCKEDPHTYGTNNRGNHTRNSENFPYDPATCPAAPVYSYSHTAGVLENNWYVTKPIFIPELTALGKAHGGIKEIVLGYQHGVALAHDGSVLLWGSDEGNRNGANRTDRTYTGIEGLRPYELCLDDNGRQALSPGKVGDDRYPVTTGCTPVKAKSIASGQFAGSLVTRDGKVIAWGSYLLGGAFGTKAQLRGPAQNLDEGLFERDGYRNNLSLMHVVWDPAKDSLHRKATVVGANKDSGILALEDGEIRVWGENGGGGACGGYGYRSCMPEFWGKGLYGAAFPDATKDTKAADGPGYYMHNSLADLYVWPPLPVSNLQKLNIRIESSQASGSAGDDCGTIDTK
jgi:alpha-tubulin suppressor-like RCC1 family protein